MARRPPRQRASGRAPDQAHYVPVRKPMFTPVGPLDRSPFPWAIFATNPYASHLLGKITPSDRNALNAILELWRYTDTDRYVETSISRIHNRMNNAKNSINKNKISESLTRLVQSGLIIKDQSGHNSLRIRVNPFVYWKGSFEDCNIAQRKERSEWPAAIGQNE